MLIPSIDIMDGRAVQLRRGTRPVLTCITDPVDLAAEFNRYGEVAVIDLDAALGRGDNRDLIKKICGVCDARVGGGIRSKETADQLLRAGAVSLIIGTAATPEFLSDLPADRVIVALDAIEGEVLDEGWQRKTGQTVLQRATEIASYCSGFLCTFVDKEGGLGGIDTRQAESLKTTLPGRITIAGGTASTTEAARFIAAGFDIQVGMALYTERLGPARTVVESLDFAKGSGLLPTVVQDESGEVLMLAYSSEESLQTALEEGVGAYWSRSRQEIWRKGATSGNTQQLLRCRMDCDRDALLFTVRQIGPACHSGEDTCFGRRRFGLQDMFRKIEERKAEASAESYTRKLLADPALLKDKLMEEAAEVVNAPDRENLVWELADLIYFAAVTAVSSNISLSGIERELGGRSR